MDPTQIPPPPAGFTIDQPTASNGIPPPPPGFTLDGAAPPPPDAHPMLPTGNQLKAIPGQVWQGIKNVADTVSSKPLPSIIADAGFSGVANAGASMVAPATIPLQSGLQAFHASLAAGNNLSDAFSDGINAGLRSAAPLAAAGAVGAGAGKVADMVGTKVAAAAPQLAYDATGAMKANLRDALERSGGQISNLDDTTNAVGQELLDQGLIKPFTGTQKSLATGIQAKLGEVGQQIGDTLKNSDDANPLPDPATADPDAPVDSDAFFDRRKAADSIRAVADQYKALPDYETARNKLYAQADMLDEQPQFGTLQEGAALRSSYGRATGNMADDNFTKDLRKQVYGDLAQQQKDIVQAREGPQAVADLSDANQSYSNLKLAEDSSVNRALSQDANLGFGLRDVGAAVAPTVVATAAGGPVLGAVTAAATTLGSAWSKTSGKQTAAWAANQIGKYQPMITAAAKQGPQAAAVAQYLLSQKDPQYAAAQQSLGEGASKPNDNDNLPPPDIMPSKMDQMRAYVQKYLTGAGQ